MPAPELGLSARATIDRVIDGDTIDVMVLGMPCRIRLLDCWAPEIHGEERPEGEKSKAFLEKLAPVGSEVRVYIPTGHAKKLADVITMGRILGQVWREGDDESLSQLMVGAGMATKEKVKK